MKDLENFQYEYQLINEYINRAISYLLKKQESECMRVLECLKLFSKTVFNAKLLIDEE